MQISGTDVGRRVGHLARNAGCVAMMLLALSGCWRYGFSGGGLPAHIKSMAVEPFDNETATPELQKQLWDAMRSSVSSRLGVKDAAESHADAVLKGTILRYDTDVPVGYSATRTASPAVNPTERQLQLEINIEIDDQVTGKVLFKRDGMVATASYSEGAETDGRKQAIKNVVQQIVEGAQSQW